MYKKIVKCFLFYILPFNLLFAQGSETNKYYTGKKIIANKTEFQTHLNVFNNDFNGSNEKIKTEVYDNNFNKLQTTLMKENLNINNKGVRKSSIFSFFNSAPSTNNNERPEKNLITSVSENIELGGFSGNFALINFTPKLNIEPVNFISISAIQNVSYFIPIKSFDKHLQLLFIQSTYILAIDNFMNLLYKTPTMIQSIVEFIAKNLVTALVNKFIENNNINKTYSITNYYYSIKIKL
jgi:hypothetical protein